MTHQNDSAFDRLSLPEYSSPEERVEQIYRKVMEKAGLPDRRNRRGGKKILLAAAICAMGLSLAAAGYFTASDAFRGHLKEQGAEGEAVELSSLSPLVDQTGQVLTLAEPVVSNGIQIAPRAIAGDDSTFTLLFDIERVNGEPLGLIQADGTVSGGDMMFRMPYISVPSNDYAGGQRGTQILESTVGGSKGTILLRLDLSSSVPMGETMTLRFYELLQNADLGGEETGLSAGEWYDAVAAFPPVPDDAFQEDGFYSAIGYNTAEPVFHLSADSEISVPLGGALDGYTLTNAAFFGGNLYLRGYAPHQIMYETDLRTCALVNEATGEAIRRSSFVREKPEEDGEGVQAWSLSFEGISSLEQLRGYRLLTNHGETMHLLAAGEWAFDIPLEYEKVVKEVPVGQAAKLGEQGVFLERADISPYKVNLMLVPGDKGQEALDEIGEFTLNDPLILELRNGGTVSLMNEGLYMDYEDSAADPPPVKLITLRYEMEAVIDPEEVVAFTFGGQRYPVE